MAHDVIIGYGEIGKAVQKAISPDANIYDINRRNFRIGPVFVMHICFPYSDGFVKQVIDYMTQYEPEYVAIWSTVPIGTCEKINTRVIHTPVEGKHPELAKSIKLMTRWIGYNDRESKTFFETYFGVLDIKTKFVPHTSYTEALKLLSTTEYGINLAYADYKKRIADDINMPLKHLKEWNQDYNDLYRELDMPQYQKFILDPPKGQIGGHCIIPNVKLLDKQYPDELLNILKGFE